MSMEFDRASVSSGVGLGAREAQLVGLQAHTLPSSEHLSLYCCDVLQSHVSLS